MKNNKGFTLVELLAVIVILAIIMIIAIPVVLDSMKTAKVKSFGEYALKVSNEAQKTYMKGQMDSVTEKCVLYNIETDLGLSNTGDYKGYVLLKNNNVSEGTKVYVTLNSNDYMIYGVELNQLEGAEYLTYDKNSTYLSKENLLSLVDCSVYSKMNASKQYETETTELISNPVSSVPENTPSPLLTGTLEGFNGWVGVYEKGNIVGCYNNIGNITSFGKALYDGSLETSYCVGKGFESTSESECALHKSTDCCTASEESTGILASQQYMYLFTSNNNPNGSKISCGITWIIGSSGKIQPQGQGIPGGGGLPETGARTPEWTAR